MLFIDHVDCLVMNEILLCGVCNFTWKCKEFPVWMLKRKNVYKNINTYNRLSDTLMSCEYLKPVLYWKFNPWSKSHTENWTKKKTIWNTTLSPFQEENSTPSIYFKVALCKYSCFPNHASLGRHNLELLPV